MIDVALLSVIRRWHLRDGMPIREISRRTGLSRNTVRKYLATGIVEPRYPKRKTPSKLDDYEPTLTSWLFRETRRHRKYRRSVKQLYRDLVDLGFTGSCNRVAAFARLWRESQKEAQRKPGALRNGAPFKTLPDSFQQLQAQLLKRPGGDREIVNILALVLLHDEPLVEQAVEMALQSGQASKEHVLNYLSRLSDKPAPAPLKPPPKLALVNEPQADTARYDYLREIHHGR